MRSFTIQKNNLPSWSSCIVEKIMRELNYLSHNDIKVKHNGAYKFDIDGVGYHGFLNGTIDAKKALRVARFITGICLMFSDFHISLKFQRNTNYYGRVTIIVKLKY